VHSAVLSSAN